MSIVSERTVSESTTSLVMLDEDVVCLAIAFVHLGCRTATRTPGPARICYKARDYEVIVHERPRVLA
jgi:hypothetical protein